MYLDDGAGVQFTLYELKKELKERGHDIDKADLLEALKICNLTNISIQTADGKALMQSHDTSINILPVEATKHYLKCFNGVLIVVTGKEPRSCKRC